MSATMADEDFYQNLMQYMNQNTTTPFMYSNPLSFSPHEAEKHSLDDAEDFAEDANDSKRRGIVPQRTCSYSVESANSAMDSGSDETESKPKKKPGRKMMMTEPANVRLSGLPPLIVRNGKHRIERPSAHSENARRLMSRASSRE